MRARPVATVTQQCMLGKAVTFMCTAENKQCISFFRWIYALKTPWNGF